MLSLSSTSPYQNLMMFKILILQAWYNLSDEALEKQIARDLIKTIFIGIGMHFKTIVLRLPLEVM
jgi:IS5 family transposase